MSHPLLFPGITYFYPIGNTSAIRLTEHLPPEQEANILLLACGDPRHILYTVYANETNSNIEPQKLDVTCCDVEAAVLARNAILFTLLADEGAQDRIDLIWNIFYHFVLDRKSLSLLIEQCRKLVTLAKDLESWNAGPYAGFLTVCDKRTLAELRRVWSLYVATVDYTPDQRKWFKKNFLDGMKEVQDRRHGNGFVGTSPRSAGPLSHLAVQTVGEQFRKFWSTGITDDGLHSTDQATLVNPTFAFSLSGKEFAVHYGADPVAGFHLAEVFATSHHETPSVLVQKLVRAARGEFSQWCTSAIKLLRMTSVMPSKLVIRMFVGDALKLCQAFSHLNSCGVTATPILSSPWRASRIEFEENQYGEGASTPAPTTFNVIDTSNISDHVGLLNLLVVTIPILSKSPSATLYTEALVSYSDTPTAGILERLCGDMQIMSLLLGIVPSAFLSRFTTRSNVHESLMAFIAGPQYHEQIAWKAIGSEHLISFTPDQLGRLLFEVYLKMFSDENLARQLPSMSSSATRAFTHPHYTRQSFVQQLNHIKSWVETDWSRVMEKFDEEVVQDTSLILGSNLYQEMCCHFHLLDVVTFSTMEQSYIQNLRTKTRSTLFRDWESIPSVVTVVIVIPRSKITAIESELRLAGTPVLQCEIRSLNIWNMFMDISAAYGRLEMTGTGQTKTATIVEEKEGESTSSPLIVFFSVGSSTLLRSPNAVVGFRTRPSPRTVLSRSLLEAIFTTPLEDSRHVHLLAEPPFPPIAPSAAKDARTQVARESKRVFSVEMNDSHIEIRSFTTRVDITDPAGQASLSASSSVKLEQTPTQGTRLCIDKYTENIYFPMPVDAANAKFRVARKSMYIELILPLAISMPIRNERAIAKRFYTVLDAGTPMSWNVHRVNLDRCPRLKPGNPEAPKWLVPHVTLMFSHRERDLREKESPSPDDTFVNLKDSLHSLLLYAAGVQGRVPPFFVLQNMSTGQRLALIFVADLRLDVGSHTVVTDSWVVPGTTTVQEKLTRLNIAGVVTIKIDPDESEAWRYLLPLLVERCRTWTHRPSCEYLTQGTIPLSPDAGADPEKSPFCSCGVGVGTETFPQRFKSLAPYATRVAISPLFAVPYLEKVGMPSDAPTDQVRCRACGKQGGSLSVCAKCKTVRYCSKECQVKDWKDHKKNCVK
ncbi:hypothetical protein OG21DRAFT_1509285 [Imleria badia]|nr:hypothetical protein OG21DRAFT_1509285 [Imleria badia]